MKRHSKYSLPVETNRKYMASLRALLGLRQYDIVKHIRDDRLIRESEVSVIEGKIGKNDLWDIYANHFEKLIESSGHNEVIKECMKTLLQQWIEA